MHRTVELLRQLVEMQQVEQVVAAHVEACTAVVSALDDMQRDAGQDEPGLSGHGYTTTSFAPKGLTQSGSDPDFEFGL
jgi:hypothetical protein